MTCEPDLLIAPRGNLGRSPLGVYGLLNSRPVSFWIFGLAGGTGGWVDREEFSALPLEDERLRGDILTHIVEGHGSLDTGISASGMQFSQDLGIVKALDFFHNLLNNLPDCITFGDITVHTIGRAAIFSEVGLDHVRIAGRIGAGVPQICDHDPYR